MAYIECRHVITNVAAAKKKSEAKWPSYHQSIDVNSKAAGPVIRVEARPIRLCHFWLTGRVASQPVASGIDAKLYDIAKTKRGQQCSAPS